MSRVVRRRVTKRLSSGTQMRRTWMFTFCQRLVLMLEWETFWASSLRFPVIWLRAMASSGTVGAREGDGTAPRCQAPSPAHAHAVLAERAAPAAVLVARAAVVPVRL